MIDFGSEFVIGFIRIFCMVLYMSKDVDLSDNVDEVKDQIREAEDLDLDALLEEEKSGKDRKTIKEFLQKRIDNQEEEITEAEDEVVEQIEEETEGGLLGGLSRDKVLGAGIAAGLVLGLIFGVAVGYTTGGPDADITADQAEERVSDIVGLQFDDYSIDSVSTSNGMYYVEATITQEVPATGNQTGTQEREFPQNFYLTLDGSLLFPEQQSQLGQVISPIDVDQELQRAQNQTQQPTQEEIPEDLQEELENQTQ